MKIIGVMDKEEYKMAPGVPTMEAQGYPVYAASARGIYAPGGTPPEVIKVLSDALKRAVANPEHQQKMENSGFPVKYMNAQEVSAYWDETEKIVTPLFKEAYEQSKQ